MKNRIVKMLYQASFFFFVISCFLFSQQEKIRIACVGNSITEGSALPNKLLDAYPIALQRYLGSGYEVKNCGVSGRTLLKKGDYPIWNENLFDVAINFNPNIVTIMLGTNDSKPYNWIYKNEFMQDYYSMIDSFKHGAANPEIYICLPLPSFSDAFDIRDSVIDADIIPMIKQIADSAKVKLIDFNTPFLDKNNLMPDGIHPLVEGSDYMARILLKELTGRTIESLTEKNVALNKSAIQDGKTVMELTDGNSATRKTFFSSSTPVIIDLVNETEIDMIQINFNDFAISGLSFTLAASKDSVDWLIVLDSTFSNTSLIKEDSISKLVAIFQPVNAKFIKFQIKEGGIPKDSTVVINQIKVFERRVIHAPTWGWELISISAQSIRIKAYTIKTNNVGEYIKIYRQLKEEQPFYIYSNYGSTVPLNFNSTIQYGTLNRYYSVVYFNGYEISSDTLIIVSSKITDVEGNLDIFHSQNYTLSQNYPNPFNPNTKINYSIPRDTYVSLKIYDLYGKEVTTLVNEKKSLGSYEVEFDGNNLSSGIYFYQIQAENFTDTKKIILMK